MAPARQRLTGPPAEPRLPVRRTGPARPFDILSEFHWTLDEHSAQANDQSLDPELLGALFERLASLVDRTVPPARRKPKGAYYTPRDVAATMVSDALTARLPREDIPGVAEPDLRKLFSGANDDTPDWPEPARERVRETLGRLSVFDPAVGSGIFLLGVLETLTAAFAKLDAGHGARRPRGATIRAIVRDQLHGCDIQPLAAQIAKPRLFLAIEAAEGAETEPLPNLEARIVNADTLGTIPDPDWTPGAAGTLHEADPEFRRLLDDLLETRRRWFEMPGRNERAACLANRRTVAAPRLGGAGVDRRIAGQWLRVPTAETRALVETLARADATVGSPLADGAGRGFDLGLPRTAYQHVTALPAGAVTPRHEHFLRFRTEEAFKLALAALNGHVFHAWWLAVDDGFDVNVHVATAMGLPDPWTRPGPERDRAIALAGRLVAAIPDCLTGKLNAGVQWRNVDFFSGVPDLVEELDRLHLAALGLPWEPTIRHLRTLRSSSSHDLADPEPEE